MADLWKLETERRGLALHRSRQAAAGHAFIESGLPTEGLPAQIAVSKYADGLPLFRQEGIYARDGGRSTGG